MTLVEYSICNNSDPEVTSTMDLFTNTIQGHVTTLFIYKRKDYLPLDMPHPLTILLFPSERTLPCQYPLLVFGCEHR